MTQAEKDALDPNARQLALGLSSRNVLSEEVISGLLNDIGVVELPERKCEAFSVLLNAVVFRAIEDQRFAAHDAASIKKLKRMARDIKSYAALSQDLSLIDDPPPRLPLNWLERAGRYYVEQLAAARQRTSGPRPLVARYAYLCSCAVLFSWITGLGAHVSPASGTNYRDGEFPTQPFAQFIKHVDEQVVDRLEALQGKLNRSYADLIGKAFRKHMSPGAMTTQIGHAVADDGPAWLAPYSSGSDDGDKVDGVNTGLSKELPTSRPRLVGVELGLATLGVRARARVWEAKPLGAPVVTPYNLYTNYLSVLNTLFD